MMADGVMILRWLLLTGSSRSSATTDIQWVHRYPVPASRDGRRSGLQMTANPNSIRLSMQVISAHSSAANRRRPADGRRRAASMARPKDECNQVNSIGRVCHLLNGATGAFSSPKKKNVTNCHKGSGGHFRRRICQC